MAQRAIYDAPDAEPAVGRGISLEDWEQMDEDEPGELVDGRIEEEEVPDFPHEIVVSALLYVLLHWAHSQRCIVIGSEGKYALSKRRGRKPDISVYLTRDRKLPRRGASRTPPDIMVEVVSPRPRDRRRDRIEKLREYAAFGVRWYWLVDPEARFIEFLRLGDDGRYVHELDADQGVVNVPGCAGLRLDLDALWREIDEVVESDGEEGEVSKD